MRNLIRPLTDRPYIGQFVNLRLTDRTMYAPIEVIEIRGRGTYLEVVCRLRVSGPDLPLTVLCKYSVPEEDLR